MYLKKALTGNSEAKVLFHLLDHPNKKSTVNALAREAGVGAGTVSVLMRKLKEEGVVKREQIGKAHLYSIVDLPVIRTLKKTNTLLKLKECKLVKYLLDKNPTISSIVLYGSHASSTNDQHSDLDLMLLVGQKTKIPLHELEVKTGKHVSLESFTLADWKKTRQINTAFYDSVIRNHVVLWGGDLP